MSEEKKTWYKGYNPSNNSSQYRYKKNNFHRIAVEVRNSYYDERLKPAADSLGITVGAFCKQAIEYYLEKLQEEK